MFPKTLNKLLKRMAFSRKPLAFIDKAERRTLKAERHWVCIKL